MGSICLGNGIARPGSDCLRAPLPVHLEIVYIEYTILGFRFSISGPPLYGLPLHLEIIYIQYTDKTKQSLIGRLGKGICLNCGIGCLFVCCVVLFWFVLFDRLFVCVVLFCFVCFVCFVLFV